MDFFIDNAAYFWLIAAIIFLLFEMGSPGLFFFLSFFCGALGAAGSTLLFKLVVIQVIIFFVITVCSLWLLHCVAVPFFSKNRPNQRTNVYSLQGKQGLVTESINQKNHGIVKVNSERWIAYSVEELTIEKGCVVEVVDVRGAHIIVKKI